MAKKSKTVTRTGTCYLCGCVDPEYGLELASADNMRGQQWKCWDEVSCEIRRTPVPAGLTVRVKAPSPKPARKTPTAEQAFKDKWLRFTSGETFREEFVKDVDQLVEHIVWRMRNSR